MVTREKYAILTTLANKPCMISDGRVPWLQLSRVKQTTKFHSKIHEGDDCQKYMDPNFEILHYAGIS